MREFPTNAVMARRMLTAAKGSVSCFNPPTSEGEHSRSPNVFVCIPPDVKFVFDITLYSFPFFL